MYNLVVLYLLLWSDVFYTEYEYSKCNIAIVSNFWKNENI